MLLVTAICIRLDGTVMHYKL